MRLSINLCEINKILQIKRNSFKILADYCATSSLLGLFLVVCHFIVEAWGFRTKPPRREFSEAAKLRFSKHGGKDNER